MLSELPTGSIVFHPYWHMGRVIAHDDSAVHVLFAAEFDPKTRLLLRESRLRALAHNQRVAVWGRL